MIQKHEEAGFDPARFNPFTAAGQRESRELLRAARAEEPVFFSPVLQAWVVTRYDDVLAVSKTPEVFSSHEALGSPPREEVRAWLAAASPKARP